VSMIDKNPFDDLWDLREFLTTDLLTSPIRRMINREAERAGIDLRNPKRSVASILGSCSMGAALGAVLGPPGGIIGGLLGYVVAIGLNYKDNNPENIHHSDTEEAALYFLELKAFQITAEFLQDYLPADTWDEICKEIENKIDSISKISDQPESLEEVIDLMFDIVSISIVQVDFNAYSIFTRVFEETKWELTL